MLASDSTSSLLSAELRPIFLLSLVFLPVCFLVVRSLRQAYGTTLRAVPGPVLAKFSRLWYLSNVYRGDFEKVNARLHQHYGMNLVRVAVKDTADDLSHPRSYRTYRSE